MTEKKAIIIIGAGIAGLAAGCYGQMNGYQTKIFELHDLPGGLCTAWNRKGYVFDGCIHYLFGSSEGQPFNHLWQELGALPNRRIINHSELIRVRDMLGHELIVYSDPDRLAAHMKQLSPVDAHLVDELVDGIHQFSKFDMALLQEKPRALWSPLDWANFGQKMAPFLLPLAKWSLVSAQEFGARFKDPFLQRAVPQMFTWPEIPMMVGLSVLAYMYTGNAGFPEGGSLEFARAIEKRYLDLGGEIHYKAQVERILTEQGKAVGVRLYNDETHFADNVISAADGRGTIFDMLEGEFSNRKLKNLYDGHMPLHTMLQVSLGVKRDFSAEPHWVVYLLDEPILIAGEKHAELSVKNYCFDPTLAPGGCSAVVLMLRTHQHYWQRIYGRRLYDTEQDQVAGIVIDHLEKIYPGIREETEIVDVATPLSYERYTGNWMGSSVGWLLTKETMTMMIQGMDKTLPGLENFYMAGQWVEPGGSVPIVAMSGKNAIQLICHDDGKEFTSRI